MPTNKQLLNDIINETFQFLDPKGDEYKQWLGVDKDKDENENQISPFPPFIPEKDGSFYPTTDHAINCIAEIIDNIRASKPELARTHGRDEMLKQATYTLGANLLSLAEVDDDFKRWQQYREALITALTNLRASQTVYVPVWLFRQEHESFSVGPVEFVDRLEWLNRVEQLAGSRPAWRSGVESTWGLVSDAGNSTDGDSGLISYVKLKSEQVSSFAAAEQRVACVTITGFDDREAQRRALLATRIAIDSLRLLIPGSHKKQICTSADHGPPRAVKRLRQIDGHEFLPFDSEIEMPGIGGKPGLAQEEIDASTDFRKAAGNCITVIINPTPVQENLPELSQRWCNAIHWYGRACVADADFVALPMFGFTLDILCGGDQGNDRRIQDLACALFEMELEDHLWVKGPTLKTAVRQVYELRSKIAHGILLAVDLCLESKRAFAESIATPMLHLYVMSLEQYRSSESPKDTGEDFLEWLKKNPPSSWSPTESTT